MAGRFDGMVSHERPRICGVMRTSAIAMLALLSPSALWTAAARAQEPVPYGRIVELSSEPAAAVSITRGRNAPNPGEVDDKIVYLTPVYAGDEVRITSGPLDVRLCNGEHVEWKADTQVPERMERGGACAPGLLDNAFAYLYRGVSAWFSEGFSPKEADTIVPMVTRGTPGGELEAPLLDSSTPYSLVAGSRPFALEWNGGAPPFTLWILPSGSDVSIVPDATIGAQAYGPATLDLPPDRYDLIIEDADGDRVLSTLEAVAAGEMPSWPEALDDVAEADRDHAELAYLAWLTTEDRRWALEAYLRARLLAERLPAADILAERLADGRILPVSLD